MTLEQAKGPPGGTSENSVTGPGFALKMRNIEKAFPGVKALDDASLSILGGEVHGLVGENGAGKSTIIKVLAGVYPYDAGSVEVGGQPIDQISAQQAHACGVRFIHQEVSLVPHFNVSEAVFLGQEICGPFGLRVGLMRRRAEKFMSDTLGLDLDCRTLVRDLTVAQRKLVQIARALIDGKANLVVFDEPTAVLTADEKETLFGAIRNLQRRGIAMVYVSHYISEIQQVCDRVTVFRNGKDVAVLDLEENVSTRTIVKLMVGRDIEDVYPIRDPMIGSPILRIDTLSDGVRFDGISFEVATGEILGVAGVIGSGREELIDSIYGIRQARSGRISIDGETVSLKSPAQAVANGLVLVPRDRRNDGLVLDMTVADNINLATLGEVSSAGWLHTGKAAQHSDEMVEQLDVRPRGSSTIVRFLSGGNQQKVVLARWLTRTAKVFVLDDPTVGVDIGARAEIYKLVATLADNGAGVVVSSNDVGELIGMCDRILVLVRGQIVADRAASETSIEELLAISTGGDEPGEVPA